MTAQEQQMLQGLVDRVNQTRLAEKDVDAEQFIAQTLGRNPDALYVMAQTLLVQGYALEQAQKQITDLRAQVNAVRPEPKHATSFLGSLLGHHEDTPRAAAPPPPPPPSAGYGPGLMYPSGGYPIAGAPPQQGGGFLRSAMQTATGVAAGALAFEGIESLMHGFGHGSGFGTDLGGAGFGGGRPEEIVNNYYGDAGTHEHGAGGASGLLDRSGDVSDRQSDSLQAGDTADANGGGGLQDASYATDLVDSDDQAQDAGGDADELSGTDGTDYSSAGDDSMLADDVGDGDQGSDGDGGGF